MTKIFDKRSLQMRWFRRLRMRRAAKRYARKLGPQLQRSYGTSERYTASQIRAAAAKLRLNGRFIALGYAAFLGADDYASIAPNTPIRLSYDEARELFDRFRPPALFSASSNPEPNNIALTGYSDHAGSP
jgi:hypothetical protein